MAMETLLFTEAQSEHWHKKPADMSEKGKLVIVNSVNLFNQL
jgi:hypothetical protein